MIDKKELRKALFKIVKDFDDNSAKTGEVIYEVLEEVYFQYQNEVVERFCLEND